MSAPLIWEDVPTENGPRARRARLGSGWLYQVEHSAYTDADGERQGFWTNGWHAPFFILGLVISAHLSDSAGRL